MSQLSPFLKELFVTDSDSMIVGTGQREWIVDPKRLEN